MALNCLKSALLLLLALAFLPHADSSEQLAPQQAASIARAGQNQAGETAQNSRPARIVSLAPSNTELLFSLNADECLVGVSTHCDYPSAAKKHERVGTFTTVNLERMARLKPDAVVLVNGQDQLAASIRRHNYNVVVLNNDSLSQIPANLRTLGNLTGHQAEASRAADSLSQSLRELAAATAACPLKPTVFYCVWPEPLMTVGGKSFLDEVITAAGGTNIARHMRTPYPHFSVETLVVANPDVIVLPNQAFKQRFLSRPPWTYLSAVVKKRVFFLPEQEKDNLSRPTLRIVEGLYWLASRLHPELSGRLDRWYAESRRSLAAM